MSKRKPYVRPMEGWWKKNPYFVEYMVHESTALFVAAYALTLLVGLVRLSQTIGEEEITALERLIDRNMAESGPLKQFVIPGRNLASAQLHVARTQSRRLERLLTAMDRAHPLRDALKRYSNRLSDALFSMARIEETRPDACA